MRLWHVFLVFSLLLSRHPGSHAGSSVGTGSIVAPAPVAASLPGFGSDAVAQPALVSAAKTSPMVADPDGAPSAPPAPSTTPAPAAPASPPDKPEVHLAPASPPPPLAPPVLVPQPLASPPALPAQPDVLLAPNLPDNVRAFITHFLPLARQQHAEFGVPVGVALAIAGYEGGCGADSHWPLNPPSNNWFNIIYSPDGLYNKGSYHCAGQDFRSYDSPENAWRDFGYLLTHDPHYRDFRGDLSNPPKFLLDIYGTYCNCSDFGDLLKIYNDWTAIYDQ